MEYINIIFQEVYKILFLLVPVLVSVAMIVWLDRRVWAFVQKRQGPNVVGPFGLLQSVDWSWQALWRDLWWISLDPPGEEYGLGFPPIWEGGLYLIASTCLLFHAKNMTLLQNSKTLFKVINLVIGKERHDWW